VDVRGVEVEAAARPVLGRPLTHPVVLLDAKPVLEEDAFADTHGVGGGVVVVVARVLAVDPADEPDVEVRVAVELLVEARLAVVADVGLPEMLRCSELGGQVGHLRTREVGVGRDPLTKPLCEGSQLRMRAGVSDWRT
jgi:hypothetical protein